MDNNFLAALRDWGCDADAGMTRLLGEGKLYVGYIREFAGQLPLNEFYEAVARGDCKSACVLADTLADAMRGLGLRPLYEPLEVLAERMREKDCAGAVQPLKDLKKADRELKRLLRSAEKRE